MKQKLFELLKTVSHFDRDQAVEILDCFSEEKIKKGTTLLHAGEICREFYYVFKGCIRTFFINREGSEKTRLVLLDCSIGTALTSFISQKPSFEFIESLEDTMYLKIYHTDFYRLIDHSPQWKDFYMKILEMAYSFQNNKIEWLTTLSAKERYQQLLSENPVLVERLSGRILSSYLDVREETLSRLRAKT